MEQTDLPAEVAAFKAAVERGDADAVDALLERHGSVRAAVDAPLFAFDAPAIVVRREDDRMVDVLLAHGADINARSRFWAGGFGVLDGTSADTADRLMARGARLDAHAAAGRHLPRRGARRCEQGRA